MSRQIIIEEGSQPLLVGNWKVGEILQAAQALAAWIENVELAGNIGEEELELELEQGD